LLFVALDGDPKRGAPAVAAVHVDRVGLAGCATVTPVALAGHRRVVGAVDLVALTRVDVTGVPVRDRGRTGPAGTGEREATGDEGAGYRGNQPLLELVFVHEEPFCSERFASPTDTKYSQQECRELHYHRLIYILKQ